MRNTILLLSLVSAGVAAAKDRHPWHPFQPGAWARYVMGAKDFAHGTVVLEKKDADHVTLKGTGRMEKITGTHLLGHESALDAKGHKVLRKEKVGSESCDVVEWTDEIAANTEWISPKYDWPLKERYVAPNKRSEWEQKPGKQKLYVAGKVLEAVRFEGIIDGQPVRMWRSREVPGGAVIFNQVNDKGAIVSMKVLESFGTVGQPPDDVTGLYFHPWASFPEGAWVKDDKGVKTTLKKKTRLTFDLGNVQPPALGQLGAAADPSSKFAGAAAVKVAGEEVPCLVFTFEGTSPDKGQYQRTDCYSPFARVPIYTLEKGSVAGIGYTETSTALGFEAPVKVGKKTVSGVTFQVKKTRWQTTATEFREVRSAEVPGQVVSTTELVDGKPVLRWQATDFGLK